MGQIVLGMGEDFLDHSNRSTSKAGISFKLPDSVGESVARTSRIVIIHEDNRTLGVGAEISALVVEEAFDCLDAPIIRVTAPDIPTIPFASPLEEFYMPSTEKIVTALEQVLRY